MKRHSLSYSINQAGEYAYHAYVYTSPWWAVVVSWSADMLCTLTGGLSGGHPSSERLYALLHRIPAGWFDDEKTERLYLDQWLSLREADLVFLEDRTGVPARRSERVVDISYEKYLALGGRPTSAD